ncbi:hypothetical protein CRG98_012007 [Punica granatum]|uniref:Uncharacterized protein n=1 Tax=Punica granatum TaxID=22663 RepID=A0A2I0KGE9_PUNGR|nr:hypothetical protein CRG98_012007 [Punica granatum]
MLINALGSSTLCAPEFHLVGTRMRALMQRGLGVSTFPGTRMRRSHHLLFTTRRSRAFESPESQGTRNEDALHRIYNREIETLKVDGMGRTNETRGRMSRPFFVCRSRCFRLPNA